MCDTMRSMVDLDELERLARAATPGPWESDSAGIWTARKYGFDGTSTASLVAMMAGVAYDDNDRRFIAAVNPSVVLALIERLRKAEGR